MTFSRNTLLAAVITLGTLAVAHDAQACRGSRGGGYSGGYSRGYSTSYNNYSSYSSGYISSPYRTYNQPIHPVQTISAQPVQQQLIGSQPIAPQQAPAPQFGQPQQQQQFAQQPVAPQQQTLQQQTAAPAPQQQQVAPQQPAPTQAAPAPAAPAQTGTAQMSALQALGGFAPPQTTTSTAPQTPTHVGNWTATLGNGASVRLSLQSDGSFNWVATNKSGTASSFSGRYTVGNGSLTLIRGNDNQQLGGNMTTSGTNAFSFKVAGNNAAAINFNRS